MEKAVPSAIFRLQSQQQALPDSSTKKMNINDSKGENDFDWMTKSELLEEQVKDFYPFIY